MNSFSFQTHAAVLLLIGLCASACYVEPQNPRVIFKGATSLPQSLDVIANPPLLNKVEGPSSGPRLGVAVIDNGVDYRHPDLARQIRSPGFDALGGDFAAHSNLINPLLFSLVASGIQNGQLTGVSPQADPIEWLNAVQNEFSGQLVSVLKTHPILSKSLLSRKLTERGVPIFFYALPRLLMNWKELGQTAYQIAKKEGRLFPFDTQVKLTQLRREYGEAETDAFFVEPWAIFPSFGLPIPFDGVFLDLLLEKEALMNVFAAIYSGLDQKHQLTARLLQFHRYHTLLDNGQSSGISGSPDPAEDPPLNTIEIDKIVYAWFHSNHQVFDAPALEFIQRICYTISKPARSLLASPSLTGDERFALIKKEALRAVKVAQAMGQLKLRNEKFESEEDRRQLVHSLAWLPKYVELFDGLIQRNPILKKYLSCSGDILNLAAKDDVLRRYTAARKHPYLSSASESESHGTHVAGIIARQSPAIQIVPVRVVTSATIPISVQADPIRQQFLANFARWIAIPGIAEAFGSSTTARTIFGAPLNASQLLQGMQDYIGRMFKENYLDQVFFDQIKKAIQYVGSQKIKVANMSLGASFNKAVLSTNVGDRRALIDSFYSFLSYEFFKFDIAVTIKQYASRTLFVIASGNDGAWLDGKSKSGLPCDLSSPSLRGLPSPVPNNQITNILCVGSIDDAKLISSFTNIPLSGIPYVMSYGESILSPVKTSDCSGIKNQMQNEMKEPFADLPNLNFPDHKSIYDDILRQSGYWEVSPYRFDGPQSIRGQALTGLTAFTDNLAKGTVDALVQYRCTQMRGRNQAQLSGTSMAAPSVSGFIAKQIVKKAMSNPLTRGLTEAQWYDHPNFSPETIIDDILAAAPSMGGSSLLKDVRLIPEIMRWKPHPARLGKLIGIRSSELLRTR